MVTHARGIGGCKVVAHARGIGGCKVVIHARGIGGCKVVTHARGIGGCKVFVHACGIGGCKVVTHRDRSQGISELFASSIWNILTATAFLGQSPGVCWKWIVVPSCCDR